jgi:hypothetical protein
MNSGTVRTGRAGLTTITSGKSMRPDTGAKSHVKHIFSTLAVSSRAQAVSQAGSIGRLRGGDPRHEEGRRRAVAVSRSNFHYAGPVSADSLSVVTGSPATVSSPSPERTLLAQAPGEDTIPPTELGFAETPTPLKPHGEKRRLSQEDMQ